LAKIADAFVAIADLPETTPDEVRAKDAAYAVLRKSAPWRKAKWACDLWTAAFFAQLTNQSARVVPTTRLVWDAIGGRLPEGDIARFVTDLAAAQPFFHWPLEFPEVSTAGRFDVILGNPLVTKSISPRGPLKLPALPAFAGSELSLPLNMQTRDGVAVNCIQPAEVGSGASEFQRPLSFSIDDADARKPWLVMSSFLNPMRRRAAFKVFSDMQRATDWTEGNRNLPCPVDFRSSLRTAMTRGASGT
jgi:hypothetical protein